MVLPIGRTLSLRGEFKNRGRGEESRTRGDRRERAEGEVEETEREGRPAGFLSPFSNPCPSRASREEGGVVPPSRPSADLLLLQLPSECRNFCPRFVTRMIRCFLGPLAATFGGSLRVSVFDAELGIWGL